MNDTAKNNIQDLIFQLLQEIGEDPEREGLIRTPERVAKAWEYLARGYDLSLEEIVGGACFEEQYDEMVTVKEILSRTLRSLPLATSLNSGCFRSDSSTRAAGA